MEPQKVKIHPLIDGLNSPDIVGVIPGSLRVLEDVRRVDARLRTNQQFNFEANSLSLDGALVGSKCELVAVCTAKKKDDTNVTTTDQISLREEASNLFWRDITLTINGQQISRNVRADIVRHVIDRFHDTSRVGTYSLSSYRQLNTDSWMASAAGAVETGEFKSNIIKDGSRFELVRPLNDLPFFAEGDSLIPGFNTIEIRALTTSEPQALFKVANASDANPYLHVEEVKLRYTTVKLEQAVASELQSLSAAGELEINGSLWCAVNLTPKIDAGAKRWTQGVSVAFGTTPDVCYFMAFPEDSFIPATDASNTGKHPLIHTWAAMSEVRFISGSGEDLRHYRDIDGIGGKVKLIHEANKSISTQGGVVGGSASLTGVCAIEPRVFILESGTGCVPFYMRNWAEASTHNISPISIRIEADLNDATTGYAKSPGGGAPLSAQPYLVSRLHHRWVLSTPGATKIVV